MAGNNAWTQSPLLLWRNVDQTFRIATSKMAVIRTLAALWFCAPLLSACERHESVSPIAPDYQTPRASVADVGVANDSTMGNLAAFARLVVGGLRDSSVRQGVRSALMAATARPGVDLQLCEGDEVARQLFAAAERHGLGSAANWCQAAMVRPGLVVYMDPEGLRSWDGTTIPIVTAIANPSRPLPTHFLGYRSTERTVELDGNLSRSGPILVVLPFVNPSSARVRAQAAEIRAVASPTTVTPAATVPLPAPAREAIP